MKHLIRIEEYIINNEKAIPAVISLFLFILFLILYMYYHNKLFLFIIALAFFFFAFFAFLHAVATNKDRGADTDRAMHIAFFATIILWAQSSMSMSHGIVDMFQTGKIDFYQAIEVIMMWITSIAILFSLLSKRTIHKIAKIAKCFEILLLSLFILFLIYLFVTRI